jgi:hypothetical protein
MRRLYTLILLMTAACGGAPAAAPSTSAPPSPTAVATGGPQVAVPTPSFAPGTCTRPGIENINVIQRWLELAGRHDPAAVRDCFAASYGTVPDQIVDRWANLGGATASQISHSVNAIHNGCDFYSVSATFPNGNPYAPVQSANQMFLVVGVGPDGDRPRIFGTATAGVNQSPDVTPHVGPPDCR